MISKNPLLAQTRARIESSLPKQYRRGYDAILAAGLQLMFSEKTFPMMKEYVQTIKGPQDVPQNVSHGIAKVISIVFNQSQGKMQVEASGAAAVTLMTHALDYVDAQLHIPITEDLLAETTKLVSQAMMLLMKQMTKMSDGDFQALLQKTGQSPTGTPGAAPTGAPTEAPPQPTGLING